MKRLLVLAVCVLAFTSVFLCVPVRTAVGGTQLYSGLSRWNEGFPANSEQLRFHDGFFKIMHITDIQDGHRVSSYTIQLITLALDAEQPDLVVLGGDNIFGPVPSLRWNTAAVEESIAQFLQPIVERGIPFCLVFGNHDPECSTPLETQMSYYREFPGCLAVVGEAMTGTGNYNLPVMGTAGEGPLLNLWFFDTGNRAVSEYGEGYNWVREDQIAWYEDAQQALAEANGGKSIPAFVFQHIPVAEIYDLLEEVPEGTEGAVRGHGRWNGGYYLPNGKLVAEGSLGEGPCPPDHNGGQFASWVRQGDVVAAFFGHDHVNDLRGTLSGIDLVYTAGAGFYSYGNGYEHGVRVIEVTQRDPAAYTTRLVDYKDLTNDTIFLPLQYKGGLFFEIIADAAFLGAIVLLAACAGIVAARRRARKRRVRSGGKK